MTGSWVLGDVGCMACGLCISRFAPRAYCRHRSSQCLLNLTFHCFHKGKLPLETSPLVRLLLI